MNQLIIGLITGIAFGFLLQKGRVIRYDKQLAALRFIDFTIVKFMLSAIIVGIVGIYLLTDLSVIELKIKSASIGGNLLGGIIFGVGWGLLGYCPGTQLGALGEGRWDSIWGVLGMIAGGMIFAEMYPFFKKTVLTWGNFGKITLPQILHVNHWIVIPVVILAFIFCFVWIEKKRL
ncbi:MAG: YeeE/YedE thiosulfate transporter family protein [Candidatus Auribacterota bacterium]|jgi:uncharacterized membrane protein YedE/YeeE|nr:YeeE/YedE thiosulfate transporter family protein [Candidatus Auribacterota bacterium]